MLSVNGVYTLVDVAIIDPTQVDLVSHIVIFRGGAVIITT
jgi:hypothetical protein